MDTTIDNLTRFNKFLDSKLDSKNFDEKFISLRQVDLKDISRNSDGKHFSLIALSYAKLMELTILLAGKYSDNCQFANFGDLTVNPRHIDVCVLNTAVIKEEYGITEGIPLWFKRQVHEYAGSQYAEDLGRMVVEPSLLLHFVEKGLLLRTVKKERHTRLSDQFRDCIPSTLRLAFPNSFEQAEPIAHTPARTPGCGRGRVECLDIASWLANSTVLNIVKGTLQTDLMDVLREVMSEEYLKSVNKKFEKAFNSLHYMSIGRTNFANFPYDDEVPIAEWAEINHTLCNFTTEGYGIIQAELNKSLSDPSYKSHFLSGLFYMPQSQDTNHSQMIRNIM